MVLVIVLRTDQIYSILTIRNHKLKSSSNGDHRNMLIRCLIIFPYQEL